LAKSLDKGLTSHPGWEGCIKSHFILAWATKKSRILAEQQPSTEVNFNPKNYGIIG